jgi:hypothetical protein
MTLPSSITAGELAQRNNPTAIEIWAAIERGIARVTWEELTILGISRDQMPSEIYLITYNGRTVLALYETRLTIEVLSD